MPKNALDLYINIPQDTLICYKYTKAQDIPHVIIHKYTKAQDFPHIKLLAKQQLVSKSYETGNMIMECTENAYLHLSIIYIETYK